MLMDSIIIKLSRVDYSDKNNFSITIQGDGKVKYLVKNNGKIEESTGHIDEEIIISLLKDFKNSDYFSLNKYYTDENSKGNTRISISIPQNENKIKTNEVYFNENINNLPQSLLILSDKIKNSIKSSKWDNKKPKNNNKSSNNKKKIIVILGCCMIISAILLGFILFNSSYFNQEGSGNNDADITNGDNNKNGDDTDPVEFDSPNITFVTTTNQAERINNEQSATVTNFLQMDTVFIDIELENIIHDEVYDIKITTIVTNNEGNIVSLIELINDSNMDITQGYLFISFETDESWATEQWCDIEIIINDLISDKNTSENISFYLIDINTPIPEIIITTDPQPAIGYEPLEVTFYCESKNFTGDEIYYWDFGDGNICNTKNNIHNYLSYGDYTVTLTVTDVNDIIVTASTEVKVEKVNSTEPLNNVYFEMINTTYYNYKFTGFAYGGNESYNYEWDFDYDGSNFDVMDTEKIVYYNYTSNGIYWVLLRVTDSSIPPTTLEYSDFIELFP